MKAYYEKNKDKFKEWSKKKIYCECCNKHITAPNYATHLKTSTHIKNLELFEKKKNNNEIPQEKVLKLMELFMNKLDDKDLKEQFKLLNQEVVN